MRLEDLEKTKEELQKKRKQNKEQIWRYDERTRMARANQIEERFYRTLACSLLPYFVLTMGVYFSTSVDMTLLTRFVPAYSIPAICVGGSLGIGTFIRRLVDRHYRLKNRFAAFSKTKTEAGKIEEEVSNKIELEKAKNKDRVLQRSIESLEDNQTLWCSLTDRCDIREKNASQVENENLQKAEEMSRLLEEKYNELAILTVKGVLSERFVQVRLKGQNFIGGMAAAGGCYMFCLMSNILPMLPLGGSFAVEPSVIPAVLNIYAPLVAGTLTGIYWGIKLKRENTVFEHFNHMLGDAALCSKTCDVETEKREIVALIERKINDIAIVEAKIQEEQRKLEEIEEERHSQEREKTIDKSWENYPSLTEDEVKLYLQESPVPFRLESIFGEEGIQEDSVISQYGEALEDSLNKDIHAKKLTRKPNGSSNCHSEDEE